MAEIDTEVLQRLSEGGNPRDTFGTHDGNTHYVATCRLTPADVPALIQISQKWLDLDWQPAELLPAGFDVETASLLPVSAWRSIGELKAESAIDPLIDLLKSSDEYDDWSCDELPRVFGQIGPAAIDSLARLAKDAEQDQVRPRRCPPRPLQDRYTTR